jgi:ribosomal protein S18 acetylase RimI-like enzyme
VTDQPKIERGFPEDQRATVAALYWQAFGAKLGRVLGPAPRAIAFFSTSMNPDFCVTAQDREGTVLGLAGFKTIEGSLTDAGWAELMGVYGRLGALWRAPFLSIMERPLAHDTLLMDGIAVTTEARGMGLGTRLLDAIADEARLRGLTKIRLDVIDTNPRARALYERQGFVATGSEALGPFRFLFGFSSSTRMERPL